MTIRSITAPRSKAKGVTLKPTSWFLTFSLMYLCAISAIAQEAPLLEWAKSFGGVSGEQALATVADGSGNVYSAGIFGATVDFDPGAGTTNITSAGNTDIFITKFDVDGNLVWVKTMGGIDADRVTSIEVDNSGNVYTTGYFYGTSDFDPGVGLSNLTSVGSADIFISKLTTNGDFVWAKSIGGVEYQQATTIAVDNSGNVFTTGWFWAATDFDPGAGNVSLTPAGYEDVFVLKLDTNGNYLWVKQFGGAETERGSTIAIDGSGNVLSTGRFTSYSSSYDFDPGPATFMLGPQTGTQWDIYVCKLSNATGDITWLNAIAGTGWDIDQAITVDNADNLLLTGYFQSTTDFDPGPGTSVLTSNGSYDPFILKLNSAGDFVWAKSITGTADDRGNSIITDAAGNVYTTGEFQGTVDFDPGAETLNMTSKGQSDIYVSKLDVNGNLVWAYSMGSSGFDFGLSIAVDGLGKIYATGSFSLTIDADPGSCILNLTSNGAYDAFVQKITVGTVPLAPTITSFSPASGPTGTSVTITGTNFSTTLSNNAVSFNGTAAVVTASTSTSISTTVPAGATTGKISVTVNCVTAQSVANFTIGAGSIPTITSFTPSSGIVGATVTITGTNFSATPANNTVRFNGTNAIATASTATSITTSVPAGATTGKITVTVSGNTATSTTDFTVTTASGIAINPQPQSISTCEGSIETFSIDASGAANITYQWQKFNGTIFTNISNSGGYSGVTTKNLTVNTTGNFGAGDYRCRVSGNATPDVFTQTASLQINPYPVADITINSLSLIASPGDSYQWYQNGTQVPQGTEQTFVLNVSEYGSYAVDVTVNGCTSTSDEFVYLVTETEAEHEGLKIYPNPFKDLLAVELSSEEHIKIKIIDAIGRPVKQYSIDHSQTLDLRELGGGAYFIIIQKGRINYYHRVQKTE